MTKCVELRLEKSHPALSFLTISEVRHFSYNEALCLKFQPLGVFINKPMKELRSRFQKRYASKVAKQMRDVRLEEVRLDVSM